MASFSPFVDPETLKYLQSIMSATTSPLPFESVDPASFRGQSEGEVSAFFDKNLELAKKQLNLAKEQRKQQKELQERQTEEDFGAFIGVQDRGFARALQQTQSGFAGRGTSTSGFRRGEVDFLRQGQDDIMTEAEREKRQAGEARTQGFEQFLNTSDLNFEIDKLGIERAREGEIIQRQQQLAQQAQAQNEAAQSNQDRDFARSFGSFLADRVGG